MSISTIIEKTNRLLIDTPVSEVFGSPVKPPGPGFDNPIEGISRIMIFGIRMALVIGSIMVLFYLLWGAFDWITGEGDQEKLDKARQKMTNAVLGIILMVAAIGIFSVVAGDVLGIIRRDTNGNWQFSLPTIRSCAGEGQACTSINDTCCSGFKCKPTGSSGPGFCIID